MKGIPTPLDLRLRNSTLICDTPIFIALAAESLRNLELDKTVENYLRVAMAQDVKVM